MDFQTKLQKLIDEEISPPLDPIIEIAKAQATLLGEIKKREENISLQVEEIYDIVKESDENALKVKSLEKSKLLLIESMVNIVDILDTVLSAAKKNDEPFINAITVKLEESLHACGLERLGVTGEHIDYRLHEVISAEFSSLPFETVIKVIRSGFCYNEKLVRKAAVIVSKGENSV
jgi:molecular chaperone GrpE (heat shock protein)